MKNITLYSVKMLSLSLLFSLSANAVEGNFKAIELPESPKVNYEVVLKITLKNLVRGICQS